MASVFSLYSQRQAGTLSDTAYWKGTRDCVDLIQRLKRTRTLEGHHGCVNTIAWNGSGTRLVSGADDRHLKIYDTRTCLEFHSVLTAHQSNIFSARFLPCGEEEGIRLVSCAGIGSVEYSEVSPTGEHISHPFQCHRSITYQVATTPRDSNEFMTCEEKGYVRLYDLRVKTECSCDGCKKDVLYSFPAAVSSMAIHPTSPYYMAFGLGDGSVQVLDRRMISNQQPDASLCSHTHPFKAVRRKYTIGNQARKITSVQFNHSGSELLASYSEDFVYLFGSRQLGCGGEGGGESVKPSHCVRYSSVVPRKWRSRVGGVNRSVGRQSGAHDDTGLSQGVKCNAKSPTKEPPVKKKLRLRGDWSDTGPEACPEAEGSESQGRSLMNHMSNMFSQWIDMSLSSDEQEREGGGVLGRARRRLNERRRPREERNEAGRGGEGRSEGEEHLESSRDGLTSSSSSDNSFNLFDEQDQETEELDSSYGASSTHVDEGDEPVEGVGGSVSTKSSGECTVNELTRVTPNSAHLSEGAYAKSSGVGVSPNRAHHNKEGVETLDCSPGSADSSTRATPDSASHSGYEATRDDAHHLTTSDRKMKENRAATTSVFKERTALDSDYKQRESTVLVESRTLNFSAVPTINIIEGETDSDDNFESRTSHDHAEGSAAGSCDMRFGDKGEADESDGHFGGRDCLKPIMIYKGHRNARTMIKQANFFGDNWVLSGSDCGRVFVWDKWTGEVVNMLMADNHVVNCIQPHPQAYLIATSGIDYDVKFWEPVDRDRCSLHNLDKVIERNSVMLEESRNTITMPSMIFLRVLSYLNRRRRMQGEENDPSDLAAP